MLYRNKQSHNPYFSRWFSAININIENWARLKAVTILILVDGFLQSDKKTTFAHEYVRHNPYFSRWFSAIIKKVVKMLIYGSHNPYFSRWFSAIGNNINLFKKALTSQSLF